MIVSRRGKTDNRWHPAPSPNPQPADGRGFQELELGPARGANNSFFKTVNGFFFGPGLMEFATYCETMERHRKRTGWPTPLLTPELPTVSYVSAT